LIGIENLSPEFELQTTQPIGSRYINYAIPAASSMVPQGNIGGGMILTGKNQNAGSH
jgi:hypothetical protein